MLDRPQVLEWVGRLTNLVAIFQKPELDFSKNRAEHDDILGDAYEDLMRHFAIESGKSKGQFLTVSCFEAMRTRSFASSLFARGPDEVAVTTEVRESARRFLEMLPLDFPQPAVSEEPDGNINLEWYWGRSEAEPQPLGAHYRSTPATPLRRLDAALNLHSRKQGP